MNGNEGVLHSRGPARALGFVLAYNSLVGVTKDNVGAHQEDLGTNG